MQPKDCWGKKRKLSDGEASASTSKKAKVEETHAVAEDTIDPFIDTVDGEDSIFATEDDQPTGTIVLSDLENNFDSTACNSEKSNETLDAYEWLADSATTSHVANKREAFTDYTPVTFPPHMTSTSAIEKGKWLEWRDMPERTDSSRSNGPVEPDLDLDEEESFIVGRLVSADVIEHETDHVPDYGDYGVISGRLALS
jgi:hypothetical protein